MSIESRHVPDWLSVSRETFSSLIDLEERVCRWNTAVNLISKSTVPEIWSRHILDSAQIAIFSKFHTGSWADLGSGGGFPGLVLAVLAKNQSPQTEFNLIESDSRKAAFLRQTSLALSVNAKITVVRISEIPPLNANVISSRALAPLDTLLEYAHRHIAPGGRAYFPKGASYRSEIAAALSRWKFKVEIHQSLTDTSAAILEVSEIELR